MRGKGAFHGKVYGHYAVICAQMAKPIEGPFELWTWVGPRNHCIRWDPEVLRDVAMATIFSLSLYEVHTGEYD